MNIKPFKVFGALLILGLGSYANAASVTLIPTSSIVGVMNGGQVSFDVEINFADVNGTIGGGLNITWNTAEFALVGFTSFHADIGDAFFGRDPDVGPGSLSAWGVGNFNAIANGPAILGNVTLTYLGDGSPASINVFNDPGEITGPWVAADGVTQVDAMYTGLEVNVPVPAAVWFMLSGLGALFGMRRSAA